MTEPDVTEIFAEIIDAFFSEKGLNEEKSVTQSDKRYVFKHEKFHGPNKIFREFLIEIGAGL